LQGSGTFQDPDPKQKNDQGSYKNYQIAPNDDTNKFSFKSIALTKKLRGLSIEAFKANIYRSRIQNHVDCSFGSELKLVLDTHSTAALSISYKVAEVGIDNFFLSPLIANPLIR
jgi:hypothetical protein